MAMGLLLVLLAFPFELLGSKFIWWTWHDTDPLLASRFNGIPYFVLFHHFFFGSAFLTAHQFVKWYGRTLWVWL